MPDTVAWYGAHVKRVADSTQYPDGVFRRAQIFIRNALTSNRGY
jgi:hypothetical protein